MEERTTLKRRGILAAAGAVVAGIVAKQASQPVAAVSFVTLGGSAATNTAATTTNIALSASGTAFTAIGANAFGNVGMEGICYGANSIGVKGTADMGYGVSATSNGIAVQGSSDLGTGVQGIAYNQIAIQGLVPTGASAANTVAIRGVNQSTGAGGFGVAGYSNTSHGVYGEAGANQGSGGVVGVSRVANGVGFQALAVSPATYAGFFVGTVSITGSLGVSGGKFAVVKGQDGQYRGMYAVESPECWFEDFGTGTLVNGVATVKLDPLFAQHVHTDAYHVFITEHSDDHLYVQQRSGSGFTVGANAAVAKLNGKQLTDVSGTFSWRVVAKRNDIKGERMPVWEMPAAPHLLDPPKVSVPNKATSA